MQCACLASQANIETLRSRDVKREGGAAELLPVTLKFEQPPQQKPSAAADEALCRGLSRLSLLHYRLGLGLRGSRLRHSRLDRSNT